MALAARPISSSSSLSGGQGARMPTGLKNIATASGLPIDELSPSFGVSGEENAQMFHEYGNRSGGRGGRRPIINAYRLPDQPTQSFTTMIEHYSDGSLMREGAMVVGSAAVAGILGRAIDAYEKTAMVISATHEGIMGGVFSISL